MAAGKTIQRECLHAARGAKGIGKMRVAAKLVVLFAGLASAVAGHAQNCSGMSLGKNASLNGFVPFPSSNLWNTDISAAPVDPNSAAITGAAGFAGLHLHFDFSSQDIYGIPYVVVDSTTTPSVPINVIDYASESDVVVAPYPANAPIEGKPADCTGWPDTYQGDAHVLVLDRATCELYETFNTNRCSGQWNASSETIWNMKTGAARPWGWTSADAAGLPIFAGLVRYDEVATGAIHHAIRFTMQHTKNDANDGYFVPPATHAAGTTWGVSNVMGMRIRLKAGFDISGFSAANQVILSAMKHYGMILADNGGYFFFQGAPDPRWDDNDLENLNAVGSENFEVVQMTPEFPGYDSATAPTGPSPIINSFTASASTVSSGKPVTLSYSVSGDSYDYIDVVGPVAAGGGSVIVNPTATRTYTLYSTNAYGQTASAPLAVTVPGSVVTPPVFTPPSGTYALPQPVTISTPTSTAATIHYTTNGSAPTTNSAVFSVANPVMVTAPATLKAIAVVPGYGAPSAVGSAAYNMPTAAATPTFSPAGGAYTAAQKVTIGSSTSGATVYYTTGGATPTSSSTKYTAPVTVAATETLKAIAVASGYTTSGVASATYTINLPAATPTFAPAAGTYTSAQTVTLADSIHGASFYYTTNGATPTTNSSKYAAPGIRVPATETIKAIATAAGYSTSAVGSATYTIATAPSVTTLAATAIGTPKATLNGKATADNATTKYWFAYGTSKTALTSTTTKTGSLTGTTATAVSATLSNLKAKTTYYFQVVASNAVGTTPGTVLSFTTN